MQSKRIIMSDLDLYRIAFMEMRCLDETNEPSASDEPYAVFLTVDLRHEWFDLDIPNFNLTWTSVFEDTDAGELKRQWVRIWGINGEPQPIDDPDDVIILVGLVEHDSSDLNRLAWSYKSTVYESMRDTLYQYQYTYTNNNFQRQDLVSALIENLNYDLDNIPIVDASSVFDPTFINEDDRVGSVQELRLTRNDLAAAKKGTVRKNLTFSGDGGMYRLGFDIAAGAG
jgi:hypothetical protein